MSKAYDHMEFDYLEITLLDLGFHPRIQHLIMQCVKTPSLFIMINGVPKGHINPSRGLRQGDSLFPYLFLLCTEGLVNLLQQAAHSHILEGIKVCQTALSINYLLFIDDILIFCKVDSQSSHKLMDILNTYARALGQCINKEKTSMVFSHNVEESTKHDISGLQGVKGTHQYEQYLRLPPSQVDPKIQKESFLETKIQTLEAPSNLERETTLTRGKEVTLKVVALAIHMYTISCFKLPSTLFMNLESIMTKFWWG